MDISVILNLMLIFIPIVAAVVFYGKWETERRANERRTKIKILEGEVNDLIEDIDNHIIKYESKRRGMSRPTKEE